VKAILKYLTDTNRMILTDIGLLVLRLAAGGIMLIGHGVGKFRNMLDGFQGGEDGKAFLENFPDPIGLGNQLSAILATSAEFFGAIFLVMGLLTRLTAIPTAFTMFVAAFIVHGNDLLGKGELALLFLCCYIALFFAGSGRLSVDHLIVRQFLK
jgi:putative oxidoreductase